MKLNTPTKVAIVSLVFLLVLWVTPSLDWALTAAAISFVLLFKFAPGILLALSGVSLVLFILFDRISYAPNFIGDLVVSAYWLFFSWLIFYLRPFLKKLFLEEDVASLGKVSLRFRGEHLAKMAAICGLAFLTYPLAGIYAALSVGYLGFIVVSGKLSNCRFSFMTGVVLLGLCPVLLGMKLADFSEVVAISAYLFLSIGVVQAVALEC